MRLEKDNAIRLFNCEAPGSEGIKLEEIFYFNNKKMPYLCGFWRFANAYLI